MSCCGPLTAYYSAEVGPSGKRGLTFDRKLAFSGVPLKLPCGQCIECKLERSRQWAMRCMHEKRLYSESSFLTLTYEKEFLPKDGYLVPRDLQLFMKRLRKKMGEGIRFYACGEYGDINGRPHYHVLLFNRDFPDKKFYKLAKRGERLYTSKLLSELWPKGFNVVGDVTFDSCAYVARYVVKKITGKYADILYGDMVREFAVMSRRPGLGAGYFDKYGAEAYAHDSVIVNGVAVRPPRFYDTRYDLVDSARLSELKTKRRRAALAHKDDNSSRRRRVKELVTLARLAQKGRVL